MTHPARTAMVGPEVAHAAAAPGPRRGCRRTAPGAGTCQPRSPQIPTRRARRWTTCDRRAPPGRSGEVARRAYRPRRCWVPWSPTRAGTRRKRWRSRRRTPRAPRSRRRFKRPAPLYYFVPVPPFVHLRPRVSRVSRISRISLEISRVPRVRPRLPPPPVPARRELPMRGSVRRRRPVPVAIVVVVVVPAVRGSVPAVVAVVPVSAVPLEGSAAAVVPVARGSRSNPSWYLSSLRPWWYPLSYLSSLRPWWYPSSYLSSLRPWWYPSSYLSSLRPYSSLRPSSTGDPPPAAPLRSGNESLRSGERAWEGGGTGAGRPPVHAASPILGLWTSAFSSLAGAFHVCEPFGTSSTLGSSPPCSLLWLGRLMGLGAEMRPRDTMRPTRWPPPGLCDWAKRREVRSAENSQIAGWQGSSRRVGGEKVRVTPGPSGHERATAAAPGPAPGDAGSGKARFDRTNDPRSVPPTGWAGQIVLNASCRAVDAP